MAKQYHPKDYLGNDLLTKEIVAETVNTVVDEKLGGVTGDFEEQLKELKEELANKVDNKFLDVLAQHINNKAEKSTVEALDKKVSGLATSKADTSLIDVLSQHILTKASLTEFEKLKSSVEEMQKELEEVQQKLGELQTGEVD